MPLPRGLILLASAWLFLAWIASMGIHPPLIAATSSYTPSVRMMMLATAVGAVVAWPLLRLSQAATHTPVRDTLLDLLVVLGMINMVLWPLRLVTPWPASRMGVLMLLLSAWIVVVGAIVATAVRSRSHAMRLASMAIVLLLTLGFAAWRAVGVSVPAFPSVFGGPVEAILHLATPGGAPPTNHDWSALELLGGVALIAWSVPIAISAWHRHQHSRRLPAPRDPDRLAAWS